MRSHRKRLGFGLAAAAVLSSGLVAAPTTASANPAGTALVINEVYGAGGNSGALYNADFVELYNPTNAALPLSGLRLQYRSAAGGVGGTATLTGSVPAKSTFLIQMSAAGSTGAALPTPDLVASPAIAMAAAGGQTILGTATTYGSGNLAGAATVVDMVGASGSTSFEGSAAGTASATVSLNRSAGADTNVNSADFRTAAPTPTRSGGSGNPDPEPGTVVPIAQIQGTNATASPMTGQTVTTEGVVTASYPSGGLNGFYLQTAGTGGGTDATPGASDAIFVYAPSGTKPAVGASVRVTGAVSEYFGLTQVTATTVGTVTPALAAVTPLAIAYPTTEAAREAHEGELLAPTDTDVVVSNTYGMNTFAEIGLATGGKPLLQPTDVADAQNASAIAAVTSDNLARGVILDDGSSTNYFTSAKDTPLPWLTQSASVSIGASVTFTGPVILSYGFDAWRFQPQSQVTGTGADVATFSDVRAANANPRNVGGDVRIATFNVLNYFPTTGEEFVSNGGSCTYYTDRAGNRIANNTCTPDGPRGAANAVNLERQQVKIVKAINRLGASVVSLEEIENSVKLGKSRDFALNTLVTALNAAAGPGTWAAVASPTTLPSTAEQDVIRNAFIYKPAEVSLVGASQVLVGASAFDNAREPLAQAFKKVGDADADGFAVVTNHFKSKGSGTDDGTGQGASNPDRVAQAEALATFAENFAQDRGVTPLFLAGDFNSYTEEDPMQVLRGEGYVNLAATYEPEVDTYSFDGLAGSLDHILANGAAADLVSGADVWSINSSEPIAYEYSRYNYNVNQLYSNDHYRASDHDPIVVGLDLAEPVETVDVNLLNINDFHGRIDANTTKFATTVEQLRAAAGADSTLFLSAGDNIGASLFASATQKDQPTLEVLNALGLDVSAVGNHEFDLGFADLTGRVSDEADFDYLGANVYLKGTTTPALPEYRTFEVNGVSVAVVGAVTEETPSLVSPAGVDTIEFGDPVAAVNRVAARLSDGDAANGEADVIVAEFHEGAGANLPDTATCADEIAANTVFGDIARNTAATVDVILTGHTHKEYACAGPVPGSATKTRPILQTGSYGDRIGQVQLEVDPVSGDVVSYTQRNVARVATEDLSLPAVAEVKTITDAALAHAAVVGNQPVGTISRDITTAYAGGSFTGGTYAGGTRDDRASESALGDLVAQALKDGVSQFATPDLGITNPGGLRAELLHAGDTATNPANTNGVVTFAEANAVLPFNNTVAVVQLTGAQLKAVLEQQWQTNPDGTVPSRPYLQLGLSENVRVTADPTRAAGQRITSVRIDGQLLDPTRTYTVSTLSFLAAGGDNFRAFQQGSYVDTGLLDAQLWRDYLAANSPVSPDFARQQVEAPGLPASVTAGQAVSFSLAKLNLTSLGAPANERVRVFLAQGEERRSIGTYAVSNGSATVAFTVPAGLAGSWEVGLAAEPSSTRVGVGGAVPAAPSIAGSVTGDGGVPVAGACVYLYTSRSAAAASYATCTDASGAYWMNVGAGEYHVAVADPTASYQTTWREGTVTVGAPLTGIDVVLERPLTTRISGSVTNRTSGAALGTVCAFTYEDGVSTAAAYASCTLADGSYSIDGLETGGYDVAFFDTTGATNTQWWTGSTGGAPAQSGATAVALATRASTAVADAAMSGETTGVVSGRVLAANGSPLAGVCVYLYTSAAGPASYGTCTQADGTWYLGGVAPSAHYRVGFADPSASYATQWWTGSAAGAPSYAGGAVIGPVTAGQTTGGVDATLQPVG
ncbi:MULTISPECIES: ExeM/NucH family extracellular endonuclease [unclassified Nocardioides]|uniref:ExeM/NucH family extracellular endonuclease n=1 Tax=unclassified Nocardioides TaxID=2615069 RepID=UPI003014259E